MVNALEDGGSSGSSMHSSMLNCSMTSQHCQYPLTPPQSTVVGLVICAAARRCSRGTESGTGVRAHWWVRKVHSDTKPSCVHVSHTMRTVQLSPHCLKGAPRIWHESGAQADCATQPETGVSPDSCTRRGAENVGVFARLPLDFFEVLL